MGTGEQAIAVGPCTSVGQFVFRSHFDDAVEALQGANGPLPAYGVADLYGAGQRVAGRLRLKGAEPVEIAEIERVGLGCLGDGNARQLVYKPHFLSLDKPLPQGADIAQVAARDNDPIGDLPVKLLQQLNGYGLLPFNAERVHRVGEINLVAAADFLHQSHAPIEISAQGERQRAVGYGLDELGGGDHVFGQ